MCLQIPWLSRCRVALIAFERFFTWGSFQMFSENALKICKVAFVAFVGFFQLSPQIVCRNRCKITLVAFVRLFSRMSFQMFSQIACPNRCKVALIAFERFFTWDSFQMFSQKACLNICKVAFVAFVPFFNCLLKLCAGTDAQSHWLHLYPLSPEWVWSQVNLEKRHTNATNATLHLFRQAIWGNV